MKLMSNPSTGKTGFHNSLHPWYTFPMITIVTGEQGIGKTSFLIKQIQKLKKRGSTGGILTPAVFVPPFTNQTDDTPIKIGFDALDISTGQQWPLGRKNKNLGGPLFGPFSFSQDGFFKAANVFKAALSRQDDFIFLDEIGPLELEKKKGFYNLLPLLSKIPENSRLCVVIRPSLIKKARAEIFSGTECRVFEITRKNRDTGDLFSLT